MKSIVNSSTASIPRPEKFEELTADGQYSRLSLKDSRQHLSLRLEWSTKVTSLRPIDLADAYQTIVNVMKTDPELSRN